MKGDCDHGKCVSHFYSGYYKKMCPCELHNIESLGYFEVAFFQWISWTGSHIGQNLFISESFWIKRIFTINHKSLRKVICSKIL